MTDKQIIIDSVDVSGCEYLQLLNHYDIETGTEEWKVCSNKRSKNCKWSCCSDNRNCYYKQLKAKEQECERLKKKLKPKLKNAHCAYFDGQTGWCKAKEFIRCNPIGCKLYTIDELSTIVDLQQQLDQIKAENEKLKEKLKSLQNK